MKQSDALLFSWVNIKLEQSFTLAALKDTYRISFNFMPGSNN